jgi:uncharacterized membrane protein YeiH
MFLTMHGCSTADTARAGMGSQGAAVVDASCCSVLGGMLADVVVRSTAALYLSTYHAAAVVGAGSVEQRARDQGAAGPPCPSPPTVSV